MASRPASIPWSGDPEGDRLLAEDPNALLLGFALDQQVTVQKAFSGPLELRRRLGHLDPARIAAADPAAFEAIVREPPALHRYPGTMARRLQDLCAVIAERYGGDGARVWEEARDGADLISRLAALPGFGPLKIGSLSTLLARRYGMARLDGLDALLPDHPTLGGVDTPEELEAYQAHKRARKAAARAAKAGR